MGTGANRLLRERSPYLQQHAHNPVDWYPWGEEAFEKARREDRLIFLSIGYSTCHWCHVMERESFENKEIATILNEHFVTIKVDREERPDVDAIYMDAVAALTGQGGWPLSAFLAPDLRPVFGGTYFPPDDRHGRPGFRRILFALADAWKNRRDDLEETGRKLADAIRQVSTQRAEPGEVGPAVLDRALDQLATAFDDAHGGFGGAPKFPPAMKIDLLLRLHARVGSEPTLRMATTTLDRMARGGLFDQLGGGFHRYSVDEAWTVPHFEKMLYDNAQLARVYALAHQLTREPLYGEVAERTLDYVLREMTLPSGGFATAQDADSEGEEGRFYVWTPDEVAEALGPDDARAICALYGIRPGGNFEGGRTVLQRLGPEPQARARDRLLEARNRRPRPLRDDKVVAEWNGLMLSGFAAGVRALGHKRYRDAARRAADFLLSALWRDGVLYRRVIDGDVRGRGFLADHAFLAQGLIDLHAITFEERWLGTAVALAEAMVERFWDRDAKGFWSAEPAPDLLARKKEYYDGATPSGNAGALHVLLALADLTQREDFRARADELRTAHGGELSAHPLWYAHFLCAAETALSPRRQIVLAGPDPASVEPFVDVLRSLYLPHTLVAGAVPEPPALIPWAQGKRPLGGRATAYVCEDFACREPVTEAAELRRSLEGR